MVKRKTKRANKNGSVITAERRGILKSIAMISLGNKNMREIQM